MTARSWREDPPAGPTKTRPVAIPIRTDSRADRAARGSGTERGAGRDELWHWLERHAAILPQELDQLKGWYADAHAQRIETRICSTILFDQIHQFTC